MQNNTIKEKLAALKNTGKRLYTNNYTNSALEAAEELWESKEGILFSYDDHGVKRLVYNVADFKELKTLLQQIEGSGYILEFLSRDKDENRGLLEQSGCSILARMKRVSNPDCRFVFTDSPIMAYADLNLGREAFVEEAQEINQTLWSVFDTRVSHLSSDEELQHAIRNGQISIYRGENGTIDAIMQTVVHPRKFYFNHAYNKADKSVIHAMILKRMRTYVEAGGKYVYAWVEEKNIASFKFNGNKKMKMIEIGGSSVYQFVWDYIDSNAYVVVKGQEALVIDPVDTKEFWAFLKDRAIQRATVVLTHGHFDHITGLNSLPM